MVETAVNSETPEVSGNFELGTCQLLSFHSARSCTVERCLEEEETPRGDYRNLRGADEVYLVLAGAESTAGLVGGRRPRGSP